MENTNLRFEEVMKEFNSYKNTLDIRDIIELFEEIENDLIEKYNDQIEAEAQHISDYDDILFKAWVSQIEDDTQVEEFLLISSLLNNLRGYGGDEQWRGDWYPITLIRDSYFEEYAQELAKDIGALDRNASWPNNCIDWKQASKELEIDYSSVDFDNTPYLYR